MPAARPALALAGALLLLLAAAVRADGLPPEVDQALQRARVPEDALAAVVQEVGSGRTLLSVQPTKPMNPASLTKLLTTHAALDRLGPAYTWSTPVWLQGRVADGVLEGSLVIKGSGDPTLVLERLWLLLRRVQQLGVQEVRGDIVLDSTAFVVPDGHPGDFDGEPIRAYNARPSALLLNYRAVTYTFVPDAAAGVARVVAEPPLAGTPVDRTVPLVEGPCNDWRATLKPSFADSVRFAGGYPLACGELAWSVADANPGTYHLRLVQALWAEMGGRLTGTVREGVAPADQRPTFEWRSPTLSEVVRDINKFSNNVMAQQLFYTLDLARRGGPPATVEGARETLRQWLTAKLGALPPEVVLENGSGLSRDNRLSARTLARLLALAYDSPVMPELMASLPAAGVDGTLRRARTAAGRAHLKTGTLRDVTALAGYVLSASGRRYVVVAMVQHPNAPAARPALEALVNWVARDTPAR